MQLGVFIPIGNNGWLISTTSPQYKPSFDLNRTIVEKAEALRLRLRAVDDQAAWVRRTVGVLGLQSGILHADGRARAVTTRIQLFATCAVLTMPPPITARMAMTIDFDLAWPVRREHHLRLAAARIHPDGHLAGPEHYRRRYEYCAEYVTIMHELWATGRSDFKGDVLPDG